MERCAAILQSLAALSPLLLSQALFELHRARRSAESPLPPPLSLSHGPAIDKKKQ